MRRTGKGQINDAAGRKRRCGARSLDGGQVLLRTTWELRREAMSQ
jgi:hypothetical protein